MNHMNQQKERYEASKHAIHVPKMACQSFFRNLLVRDYEHLSTIAARWLPPNVATSCSSTRESKASLVQHAVDGHGVILTGEIQGWWATPIWVMKSSKNLQKLWFRVSHGKVVVMICTLDAHPAQYKSGNTPSPSARKSLLTRARTIIPSPEY